VCISRSLGTTQAVDVSRAYLSDRHFCDVCVNTISVPYERTDRSSSRRAAHSHTCMWEMEVDAGEEGGTPGVDPCEWWSQTGDDDAEEGSDNEGDDEREIVTPAVDYKPPSPALAASRPIGIPRKQRNCDWASFSSGDGDGDTGSLSDTVSGVIATSVLQATPPSTDHGNSFPSDSPPSPPLPDLHPSTSLGGSTSAFSTSTTTTTSADEEADDSVYRVILFGRKKRHSSPPPPNIALLWLGRENGRVHGGGGDGEYPVVKARVL
jgi:hypothetical protein